MRISSQVFKVDVVPLVVVFWIFKPWNAGFDISGQYVASIFRVNQFEWRFGYILSKSRNKQTLHDAETQKTDISVHMV
jgi:hypothetical protein